MLAPGVPLNESRNVAFSGTAVLQGRLLCVVFATGSPSVLACISCISWWRALRPLCGCDLQVVSQTLRKSMGIAVSSKREPGLSVVHVCKQGDSTVLGQIAAKINSSRTRSSLEIQIEHFVHLIAFVALAVGGLSLLARLPDLRHLLG